MRPEGLPLTLAPASLADTVPFGEVVTQPPTITSRPRGRGPAAQVSSGDNATHPLGTWEGSGGLSEPVTAPQSAVLVSHSSSLSYPISAHRLDGSSSS